MPSAPVRPGDDVIMRIAPRRDAWFEAGVLTLCLLFEASVATWLVVQGLWGTLFVSLPLAWFLGWFLTQTVRDGISPLVLTSSQFLVPHGIREWTAIDAASIAEVHVSHFDNGEAGHTWYLRIATADGWLRDTRVDENPRYSRGRPDAEWKPLLPLTGAHEAAAVLAAHVVALQGPDGPLAQWVRRSTAPNAQA